MGQHGQRLITRELVFLSLPTTSWSYFYLGHVVTYIVLIKGRIMAKLFILSYSDAVSFRDIRGHLGTILSIVTFYMRLS
jgi:hypothetical protein